jgi:hypothetical protein
MSLETLQKKIAPYSLAVLIEVFSPHGHQSLSEVSLQLRAYDSFEFNTAAAVLLQLLPKLR